MTYISQEICREVFRRAEGFCEYCLLSSEDAYFKHEIDHVIAEKHRGITTLENLA